MAKKNYQNMRSPKISLYADTVTKLRHGYLYDPEDSKAWANEIEQLCTYIGFEGFIEITKWLCLPLEMRESLQ